MKYIILLIFAIMCAGTCVAQTDVIRINDVMYSVVAGTTENEPTISQVWGKNIPMRITTVHNNHIFISTAFNRHDINQIRRQGQYADRNQVPQLRYYIDGGNQQQLNAGPDSTGNTNVYVPLNGHNGNRVFSAQWYWPNLGGTDIYTGERAPDLPETIGPEYFLNNQ